MSTSRRLPTLPPGAVVFDIDDTLAEHGTDPLNPAKEVAVIGHDVFAAITAVTHLGGHVGINTGRRASDILNFANRRPDEELVTLFSKAELRRFDFVVMEMGSVIAYPREGRVEYAVSDPTTHTVHYTDTPSQTIDPAWRATFEAAGVPANELWMGRCVISSRSTHKAALESALATLGLDATMELVDNAGAVNVVPKGINKVTGLRQAAAHVGIPLDEMTGVGNSFDSDGPFMLACGRSVAVANADSRLRAVASGVTKGERGVGSLEVLNEYQRTLTRRLKEHSSSRPPAPPHVPPKGLQGVE